MKCPNCKEEMEKGALMNNGNRWTSGGLEEIFRLSFIGGDVVYAFKCPKCGKVELATEVNK